MPNISVLTLFVLVLALFSAARSDSQDIVTVPLTKRNNFTLPDGTFDFQAARRSILATRSMYQHNAVNLWRRSISEFLATNIPHSLRKIEFIERLLPLKGSQPLNFDPQVLYTGKITIGNPPQEFTVGFGTALGNTWIDSASCKDKNTGPRKKYISCKSHDFKEIVTRHHRMRWAKNVYSDGYGYRDTMTIANIVVKGQYFIGVASPPERYVGQVDGMVGLAFDGLSPRTPHPFMDTALNQEQIKLPIFGVSFAPANSEFHFGGTNPKLYWSPLEDHKVIHFKDSDREPSYWLLGNAQLQANGKLISNNMQTIVSTGFEFTFGPKAEVKKIYASIHGYRRLETGAYVFPCGSAPKVTLSWDDKEKWEFFG
ncbi:aspartic peptidase domain-containing protein [Amanita rubescens]|nr:aspartic peptidase domain-containing protein [Amanita rubescens]